MPENPGLQGADLVTTSAHKRLDALEQTAMIHRYTDRVPSSRVQKALAIGSLETAIVGADRPVRARFDATLEVCARTRTALAKIPGVHVVGTSLATADGKLDVDPTNVVFRVDGSASGSQLAQQVSDERVHLKVFDGALAVAHFPFGCSRKVGDDLVSAVDALGRDPRPMHGSAAEPPATIPVRSMRPREAADADEERIPLSASKGRISARMLAAFPPAQPLLTPGEVIDAATLRRLEFYIESGSAMVGLRDGRIAAVVPSQAKP